MSRFVYLLATTFFLCTFFSLPPASAQAPGDLAIIGWNADGDGDILFVTFTALAGDTRLHFSDNEWDGAGWADLNEGFLTYIAPAGGLIAGDVLHLINTDSGVQAVTRNGEADEAGSFTRVSGNFALAGTDAFYAYLGPDPDTPTTFLSALSSEAEWPENALTNTGLTEGATALVIPGTDDNGHYTGPRSGSRPSLEATIRDPASFWETTDGPGDQRIPFNTAPFDLAPLPVELTAFTAVYDAPAVHLAWTTATETNNAGFELQWRRDGDTPGIGWAQAAFITGRGTTTVPGHYRSLVPVEHPGRYRFRLKQIDYNGDVEFGQEVIVTIAPDGPVAVSPAYPNPFRTTTRFSVTVTLGQRVSVEVVDVLGRRVQVLYRGVLAAGFAHPFSLEAAHLPTGRYLVNIRGETFAASQPVFLQR